MVDSQNFALIVAYYSLALRKERNNTSLCAAFYSLLNYCTKADQSNYASSKIFVFLAILNINARNLTNSNS